MSDSGKAPAGALAKFRENTFCPSGISLHWHISVKNTGLKNCFMWRQNEHTFILKDQCGNGQAAGTDRYYKRYVFFVTSRIYAVLLQKATMQTI